MKYIMMMAHSASGIGGIETWPKADIHAHVAFMMKFVKGLSESGELVSAEGLDWPPSKAKLVRAGKDGEPVTDGVFPETKEFLAGFWIVDVESPERAYQLAAQASAAPGLGGKPMNMAIEVRRVMSGPPEELMA